MPVEFFATWPHFLEHLAPIWCELSPEARGTFWTTPELVGHAALQGVQATAGVPSQTGGPVVVAANGNLNWVRQRPVAYVAHGIGQQYGNEHASYVGGKRRDGIDLFLHPGEMVAARERAAYPNAEVLAIGSPMMDRWHAARGTRSPNQPPLVALSFHWDCTVSPEARSALDHYRGVLGAIGAQFDCIGHGHPRAMPSLADIYERAGIPVARDFEEVLTRADVYVCDNSSTIYEFASCDRPVVVMNAPSYRRGVEHGLRFWEYADVGVQCDDPGELAGAITAALADSPEQAARRSEISDLVYVARDGKAAFRAAQAIEGFTWPTSAP